MFSITPIERYRLRKERWLRYAVSIGGVSVILAITLIFFYLLYIVLPLFSSAEVKISTQYPLSDRSLYLGVEEQGSMAVRITANGDIVFF